MFVYIPWLEYNSCGLKNPGVADSLFNDLVLAHILHVTSQLMIYYKPEFIFLFHQI